MRILQNFKIILNDYFLTTASGNVSQNVIIIARMKNVLLTLSINVSETIERTHNISLIAFRPTLLLMFGRWLSRPS